MQTEKRREFLINFAYFSIICLIIYFAIKFLSSYFTPFLIGIFASFIVQRPALFLSKKTKISKNLLTILFVVLTYAALLGLVVIISYFGYTFISDFIKNDIPNYIPTIKSAFEGINLKLGVFFKELPKSLIQTLNTFPERLIETVTSWGGTFITNVGINVVKATPSMIITIIVTLVASCYIAKDYDKVITFIKNQISAKALDIITDIKELFTKNIFKILRGYLILMFITFLELCVFLAILGKPNFATLAAIIAIVDVLPVLGTGTIVIPWTLYSRLTGDYFSSIILILAYIIIAIVRNFLEPRIVGQQIGLNPLVMLISLFVGLRLLGFAGMLLLPLSMITITELQKRGKINIWKTNK